MAKGSVSLSLMSATFTYSSRYILYNGSNNKQNSETDSIKQSVGVALADVHYFHPKFCGYLKPYKYEMAPTLIQNSRQFHARVQEGSQV